MSELICPVIYFTSLGGFNAEGEGHVVAVEAL